MHRDGYGFLIPERPIEGVTGDIYIPPDSAQKAMHGDRVLVRIARIEAGGRADGEIVKVLKRAHPTVVGEFRIRRRGIFVVPAGRSHPAMDRDSGRHGDPAAGATVDRIGVKPVEGADAGRSGRHDRERRAARISRGRRAAPWAA